MVGEWVDGEDKAGNGHSDDIIISTTHLFAAYYGTSLLV